MAGGPIGGQLQQVIDSAPQGNLGEIDYTSWANQNVIPDQRFNEPAYLRSYTSQFPNAQTRQMPSQPNYAQQAFGGLNQAAQTMGRLQNFDPMQVQAERVAAERIAAGQLANTNLDPYMNPFTQNVIETSMGDLERQRLMQQQQGAAQAARAGAFGGSRQGVAESLTNEAFARQGAQMASGLRQAGFTQAQQQAQQDLARQMQASQLNQATGLQASLANQSTSLAAQRANQQAALQAAQLQMGAATGGAGIGQQQFNMGQTVENQIAQQGGMQRALQQQLIDAGRGQFNAYAGMPASTLGYVSSALGAAPVPQTTTQSRQPGFLDYLTLGASVFPSDVRLKKDIELVDQLDNGIEVYTWKWTDEAKSLGADDKNTRGVIAQKIMETIPEAVVVGESGYYMVDYGHPELHGALA